MEFTSLLVIEAAQAGDLAALDHGCELQGNKYRRPVRVGDLVALSLFSVARHY